MKFRIEHELAVPAHALWTYLFDPTLEELASRAMHVRDCVVETRDAGDFVHRSIRGVPEVEAPAFVTRAIGARSVTFSQEDVIPKDGTMAYAWSVVTETPAASVTMRGKLRVEPIDATRCRRVIDGEVHVPLFAVGALVERFVAAQTERNYRAVASVQESWIQERVARDGSS